MAKKITNKKTNPTDNLSTLKASSNENLTDVKNDKQKEVILLPDFPQKQKRNNDSGFYFPKRDNN